MAGIVGILGDLKRAVSAALDDFSDETAIQIAERLGEIVERDSS